MSNPSAEADLATEAYAHELDSADPLAGYRDRFYMPPETIYLDGNSLGLLSRDAEAEVLQALADWKRLGVGGWLQADPPWFFLGEELGALTAPLIGAEPDEVVVTGATTVNLHNLIAAFYQPSGRRRRIVATTLDFPSDLYALQSQIAGKGGDPNQDLVLVPSRDGSLIGEADVIAAMSDEVALVVLPSVFYRSGQLLDLAALTGAAHARGIPIGFDCAHSVGTIPHEFDEWGVDFACWCSYKYLNAGPGAIAGLYVNRRHFDVAPGMAGWWGYQKARQFDMLPVWEGAAGAAAWQIGTPPVLSTVPLRGTLRLVTTAGIEHIRAKSLAQTAYLMDLLAAMGLTAPTYGYQIATPREPHRRGSHVAVRHPEGPRIARALKRRGIIPDFRPPDVVRLAPVALYTSYVDLWLVARALKEIVDTGEHQSGEAGRDLVA